MSDPEPMEYETGYQSDESDDKIYQLPREDNISATKERWHLFRPKHTLFKPRTEQQKHYAAWAFYCLLQKHKNDKVMENNIVSWLGEEAKIFVDQIHEQIACGSEENQLNPISTPTTRVPHNDLLHGYRHDATICNFQKEMPGYDVPNT